MFETGAIDLSHDDEEYIATFVQLRVNVLVNPKPPKP